MIAVTGKVTAGERKRCMDAGADGYVPKPVDQAELFAALRPWLPLSRPSWLNQSARTCPRPILPPSVPRSPSKASSRG